MNPCRLLLTLLSFHLSLHLIATPNNQAGAETIQLKMEKLTGSFGIQNIKTNQDGTLASLLIVVHVPAERTDGGSWENVRAIALDKARKYFSDFLNMNVEYSESVGRKTVAGIQNGRETGNFTETTVTTTREYSRSAAAGLRLLFRRMKSKEYVVIYGWSRKECAALSGISMRLSPRAMKEYTFTVKKSDVTSTKEKQLRRLAVPGAVLNPVVRDAFLLNPMLFEGGGCLHQRGNGCYVLIGVGRGILAGNGFEKARLMAETKAEQEAAAVLNPVLVESKKHSKDRLDVRNDNAVATQAVKECYKSLLKAYYNGVETAGFWFAPDRSAVYYIRIVTTGTVRQKNGQSVQWPVRCRIKCNPGFEPWENVLRNCPWLVLGGSSPVIGPDGKPYLLIVSSCKISIPSYNAVTMLRLRAEKYVSGFFKGNKLTQLIRSISELNAVNDNVVVDEWRKNRTKIESAAKMDELTPIAVWNAPKLNLQFAGFIYPMK